VLAQVVTVRRCVVADAGNVRVSVLDPTHKLVLQAVAQGRPGTDSPAMRQLVATGLVEQRADGGYDVTPDGRIALEDDEPAETNSAARLRLALALGVAVFSAAWVIRWLI
jgi:hypothetical protein